MTPDFSIILPCYNEAETIPLLLQRFAEVLGERSDLEVVLVDNGSGDNTAAVLREALADPKYGFVRTVTVEKNIGYGFGILSGLRAAQGRFIGWTHADSQYDPAIVLEGFARLIAAPGAQKAFLKGRRVRRGWFDAFFTAGMSAASSLLLGTVVSDVNAQPKLFPREFMEFMQEAPHDFSLDLYALVMARRHGYAILELPVVFGRRLHGEAKGGGSVALKWKLTKRTFSFILQLRRKLRSV